MVGITAFASALGLARSTALGTGTLTGVVGFPANSADPVGTAEAITAWGTAAPTFTAGAFLRRWSASAAGTSAVGIGMVWNWEPPGLYVPGNAAATSEVVLVNLVASAAATYDLVWVYDES